MTVTRKRRRAQSWSWQKATSWQQSLRPSLKRFVRPIKKPSPPSASLANTPRWVLCKDLSAYTTINKTEWVHFFFLNMTDLQWFFHSLTLFCKWHLTLLVMGFYKPVMTANLSQSTINFLYCTPIPTLHWLFKPVLYWLETNHDEKIMKRCMVITLKGTSWLFFWCKGL